MTNVKTDEILDWLDFVIEHCPEATEAEEITRAVTNRIELALICLDRVEEFARLHQENLNLAKPTITKEKDWSRNWSAEVVKGVLAGEIDTY